MAISLRAAGTATSATAAVTTVNPSVPTGTTTGDLSVLTVAVKPFGTTLTTPTGWTKVGEGTNGTVANGADVGSTKVAVYVRESAPQGVIGNIGQTGADSLGAVIHSYQKAAGETWDFTASTIGADAANGTNYSATGAANITAATGDWVFAGTAVNSDAGTLSAALIAGMTGATLGTTVTRTDALVTTGNDIRLLAHDRPVTAGTSTSAPVLTYTNASTTSGTTLFLRLRAVPAKPKTSTQIDDFAVDSKTTKWPGNYGNSTIANGVVTMTSSGASQYGGLVSTNLGFDATESYVSVKVTGNANPDSVQAITLSSSTGGTQTAIQIQNGTVSAGTRVNYGFTTTLTAPIPVGTVYLGVGEGVAGAARFGDAGGVAGTLRFYYLLSGTTWTRLGTGTLASPAYLSAASVGLANDLNTTTGNGVSVWDDFNILPVASTSFVASLALSGEGLLEETPGAVTGGVPKMETLTDDFSTNTRDEKWFNSYGTVSISGGTANITAGIPGSEYSGLQSTDNYDFRGSYAFARVMPDTAPASTQGIRIEDASTLGTQALISYNNGVVTAGLQVNYGYSSPAYTGNVPMGPTWLGIGGGVSGAAKFGDATGVAQHVRFYTSADGMTWTRLGNTLLASPGYFGSSRVLLSNDFPGQPSGSYSTVQWDNFNVPGTIAFTGSLGLSGSGSLTAAATPKHVGVEALSGSGALTTSRTVSVSGVEALSGSGSLSTSRTLSVTGVEALSGSGALTTSSIAQISGGLNLSGSGTLSYSGSTASIGGLSLTGSGAFTASAVAGLVGTGALSGSGTLSTARLPRLDGVEDLAGSGALILSSTSSQTATEALSGSGALTIAGSPSVSGSLNLSGAGALSFSTTSSASGSLNLTGSGTLASVRVVSQSRSLALSGSGTLNTSTTLAITGTSSLAGSGTLTSTRTPSHVGTEALSGSGSLSTSRVVGLAGTEELSGSGTLSFTTVSSASGSLSLTGSGALAVGAPVETRRNLFPNARPVSTAGDIANGFALSYLPEADGEYGAVRARRTVTVAAAVYGARGNIPAVEAGVEYTFRARVRSSVAQFINIRAEWNGSTTGTPAVGTSLPANTWMTVSIRAVAPAGTLTASLGIVSGGGAVDDTVDISQRMIVAGDYDGPYFDGSSATSGSSTYGWSGTPNSSSSVEFTSFTLVGVSGSLDLSGSGSLSTSRTPSIRGARALTGQGSLNFSTATSTQSQLDLTGDGSLSGTGAPATSGALSLSGSGALGLTNSPLSNGSLALSGNSTLSLGMVVKLVGSEDLGGSGALTVAGSPRPTGVEDLSGSGALTTSRTLTVTGGVALSGAGSITLNSTVSTTGQAALSGAGTLSTASAPRVSGGLALSGGGSLTSAMRVVVVGTLDQSGVGTLRFTTATSTQGALDLSGGGSLTGTSRVATSGSTALSGSGLLELSSVAGLKGAVSLSGAGALTTSRSPLHRGAYGLSGAGTLSGAGVVALRGTLTLTGTGLLSTVRSVELLGYGLDLTGSGVLSFVGLPMSVLRDAKITAQIAGLLDVEALIGTTIHVVVQIAPDRYSMKVEEP